MNGFKKGKEIIMYPAVVILLSIVASHSCTEETAMSY